MCFPDPVNDGGADALLLGHGPATSVGGILRLRMESNLNDLLYLSLRVLRLGPTSRPGFPQCIHAFGQESLTLLDHGRMTKPYSHGDISVGHPLEVQVGIERLLVE